MLSRLALRIAVMEALAPTGAAAFPTIAQNRVFDSRIDHLDSLDAEEARPLLVITTDDTVAGLYGTAPDNPEDTTVTLTVEAMVATRGTVSIPAEGGGAPVEVGDVYTGATDAEREAVLDLLEAQLRRVLARSNRMPTAALLREVVVDVHHIDSQPFRDSDRAVRLSARAIKFSVRVFADEWPLPGLAGLPQPLARVAAALPAGSPYTAILASLAATLSATPALPAAPGEIHIAVGIDRLPASEAAADSVARVNL